MIFKENKTQNGTSTLRAEKIVDKLYALRKEFEADYSGALRSRKYEATRDFTIDLNHAIFEANQMTSGSIIGEHLVQLENKLNRLRKDLKALFT